MVVLSAVAMGQTQINLRTQSRDIDFSGAAATRPVSTNSGLPPTCTVGQMYFRSDVEAGKNLYGCPSPNTWVVFGGGGEFQDFKLSDTPTQVTLSCIGTCSYRVGERVFGYTGNSLASALTGSGATGNVFFYINAAGVRAFGHDGTVVTGATLSNLTAETGMTAFPPDSLPLGQCQVLGNQFQSCLDMRAVFSRVIVDAGPGILISQNPGTGRTTVATNPSYVATLSGANTFTGANSFVHLETAVAAVSFSATPVFDGSVATQQTIVLTGNVTAASVINMAAGGMMTFKICQDGTGSRTFTWPSNVHGGMTVGSLANRCNVQQMISFDGTELYALSPGKTDIL
jgi:hypothetical protein